MLDYCADVYPGSRGYAPPADPTMRSFPFRFISSGLHRTKPSYYTKRDQFHSYMLIVTIDGCGRMLWKNRSCLLQKGTAVLIDTRLYQEYAPLPGQNWDFYYLHFDANCFDGYREPLLSALKPIQLRSLNTMCQLFEHIYTLSREGGILTYAAQSHIISAILTELMYSMWEDASSLVAFSRTDISALASYIESHCTEDLRLEQFTEYTKLSKHHLIRTFRQQMGMSPMKYLHRCRISHAQQMLCSENQTIQQIANAVGYRDPIVFTRHFKELHGMTPTAYRMSNIRMTNMKPCIQEESHI